jgi:D-glycero-D-manno-heptose 1,7-bisphosphate phosphatase
MMQEIAWAGGRIEAVLCCPHSTQAGCDCRKPAPGLLRQAREEYEIDLGQAILVGDTVADMQTAAAVGMPAIMVLTGIGRISDLGSTSVLCRVADDLAHATQLILNEDARLPETLYQQLAL